ncbi:arginine-tRNA-protein transferase [Pseudohyphozyma bogoriensis]|nr:arginine-tRNA-protein transferase [Pseudohyphozyma bogoriensis]
MSLSSSSATSSSLGGSSSYSAAVPLDPLSILQPLGYTASQCGYCAEVKGLHSQKKTGRSYGCWAHALSCSTYKDLLNCGWRRSGKYLYKPDMKRTCCPQYTITLDAEAFSPSKSQRQLLHRFSTFMIDDSASREGTAGWGSLADKPVPASKGPSENEEKKEKVEEKPKGVHDSLLSTAVSVNFSPKNPVIEEDEDVAQGKGKGRGKSKGKGRASGLVESKMVVDGEGKVAVGGVKKNKGKGKNSKTVDLVDIVHEGDWVNSDVKRPFKHRFEYVLEEASFTEEKYALFREYQTKIHNEPDSKVTPKGFRRFLVDSPLDLEPTGHPDYHYGSHHAKYLLDGKLIAMAVLDILPGAVSSVYFVWSPLWAGMGLGKVSALREAAMVREMKRAGVEGMTEYMMGFYIHTCAKMKYKGEYQPSSLLDPETNVFYPWEHCRPLLDASTHASFSRPEIPPSTSTTAIPIPNSAHSPSSTSSTAIPLNGAPPLHRTSSTTSASGGVTKEEDTDSEDDLEWPDPSPPGCLDPEDLPKVLLVETTVLEGRTLVPLLFSSAWHDKEHKKEISECLAAVGEGVKGRVALWVA